MGLAAGEGCLGAARLSSLGGSSSLLVSAAEGRCMSFFHKVVGNISGLYGIKILAPFLIC